MSSERTFESVRVKVWCDSGANIHSCNEEIVSLADLGVDDLAEWDAADEQKKWEFARDYWSNMGLPEIGCEEVSDGEDDA